MQGKENSAQGIFNESLSRRRLLKGGFFVLGGIATATILPNEVSFDPYSINYTPVTPAEREALRRDGVDMIAHYAGNSEKGSRGAAAAGYDFADGDILLSSGQMYITHAARFGPFMIDVNSKKVRFGLPNLTAERAFEVARQEGIGLFLELKRGHFENIHIRHLLNLAQETSVRLYLMTNNYSNAEMIVNESNNPQACVFNPYEETDWSKFFEGQTINTVLTSPYWIKRFAHEILQKGTTLFVNEIDNPEEATQIAKNALVKGFMYDANTPGPILTVAS